MSPRAVIHLFCAFGLFQKGLTAVIQTQRTVMAALGEEARFSCQLMQSKDVIQVTWQKLSPEGEKNLATYTEDFGQRVNAAFRDKVEFTDAALQNSSIVIRQVTEQDEGCYQCLFNAYPEGALTATTCLQLYELHEPTLHVRESNGAEETVVSCSATGRPAPTVTLSVQQQDLHFSHYSSDSVTNSNGTVTVTTTAVLSGFHDDSTQVGCAAQVLSGPQMEVFMMIPEVKQSSDDGFYEKYKSENSDVYFTPVIVSVVLVCVLATAVIAVQCIRMHRKRLSPRDSENKTPQKTTASTHKIKTPLIQHENEQLRLRMSTEKRPKSNNRKASSLTAKCQLFTDTE